MTIIKVTFPKDPFSFITIFCLISLKKEVFQKIFGEI